MTGSTYARYVLAHAMVGYNFWFGRDLLLRPSLWVGTSIALLPVTPAHLSGTIVSFMLAPGLSLHYVLGEAGWYAGVDVRFVVPLGDDTKSGLPILLTFGKRF